MAASSASVLYSAEKNELRLAEKYYEKGEYYQALTEIDRMTDFYNQGKPGSDAYLLRGKTLFMGDNYTGALGSFTDCIEKFPSSPQAEEAMYLTGRTRMVYGSTLYSARDLSRYLNLFPQGRFAEDAKRDICYITALGNDLKGAREEIKNYTELHPDGKYAADLAEIDQLIIDEINRPRKSVALSVGCSFLIPGFGHFYTGKIKEGLLSLASNALFIFLTADAIVDQDRFRALFFGFVGLTFYQHSLVSAVSNVYEYNSNEKFVTRIKIRILGRF